MSDFVQSCGNRLHAGGGPSDVLTVETVQAVFGIDSQVIVDPIPGRPLVLPISRHHVVGRTS